MKLFKNGVFHTMETESSRKYQMATENGIIIGFDDEIKGLIFDEEIDLKGYHVYPGFVDAHLHLLGYGQKLSRPNLYHIKSKTAVLLSILDSFNSEPYFAEGYVEQGITAKDLDRISTEFPIYLRHNDYHSITVNHVVLRLAGIKNSNGVLTEKEAERALATFPKYTNEKLCELLQKAISSLYTYGITGGHSDDLYYFNGFKNTVSVFEETLKDLPFRAHLLMHHQVLDDYVKSNRPWMDQSKYLQLGAIKMFYDGTLSSKTALMKAPYANSKSNGLKIQSDIEFIKMIQKVRSYQLPLAIHVIGDLGLDQVIDILKKYPPKKGLHDRLIHTPYMDLETIDEMKKIPVSLDIQPQFLSSDLPWALDFMSKAPELIFPWKSLLHNGFNLAGSSDAPVEIPNPLLGIYAATERRSNMDSQIYVKNEQLSRFEAVSLYTKYANYSTMKENRGFLKKGFVADLSIFESDILTMSSFSLLSSKCMMTFIDEKIVYRSELEVTK